MVSVLVFLFGIAIGSFVNAWVYRTHTGLPLVIARSQCTRCQMHLKWYDNIPLLSFVWLRGKCRYCRKPISVQYPLVELWMGCMFLLAYLWYPPLFMLGTTYYWFLFVMLTFIFLYDLRYGLILDRITLPTVCIVLLYHFYRGPFMIGEMIWIGGLVGAGFFLLQYVISRGKWVGGGDIRLGLLMGVILGWQALLVALLLAYVGGSLISLGLLWKKKVTMKSAMPFGVFLVPATIVSLFYGQEIFMWYVNLIGW